MYLVFNLCCLRKYNFLTNNQNVKTSGQKKEKTLGFSQPYFFYLVEETSTLLNDIFPTQFLRPTQGFPEYDEPQDRQEFRSFLLQIQVIGLIEVVTSKRAENSKVFSSNCFS